MPSLIKLSGKFAVHTPSVIEVNDRYLVRDIEDGSISYVNNAEDATEFPSETAAKTFIIERGLGSNANTIEL